MWRKYFLFTAHDFQRFVGRTRQIANFMLDLLRWWLSGRSSVHQIRIRLAILPDPTGELTMLPQNTIRPGRGHPHPFSYPLTAFGISVSALPILQVSGYATGCCCFFSVCDVSWLGRCQPSTARQRIPRPRSLWPHLLQPSCHVVAWHTTDCRCHGQLYSRWCLCSRHGRRECYC